MSELNVITQDDLVKEIKATLRARPYKSHYSHVALAPAPTEPAAYALVLGAGFSYGIVPLVREPVEEAIGDYYCCDQDQSSMERPAAVRRKDSKQFWSELNLATGRTNKPTVELNNGSSP